MNQLTNKSKKGTTKNESTSLKLTNRSKRTNCQTNKPTKETNLSSKLIFKIRDSLNQPCCALNLFNPTNQQPNQPATYQPKQKTNKQANMKSINPTITLPKQQYRQLSSLTKTKMNEIK